MATPVPLPMNARIARAKILPVQLLPAWDVLNFRVPGLVDITGRILSSPLVESIGLLLKGAMLQILISWAIFLLWILGKAVFRLGDIS